VNVQLVDVESGLWAERLDKSVADLFDMQDEIVSRLANAIPNSLRLRHSGRAPRIPMR
jgi:TolB-like protein